MLPKIMVEPICHTNIDPCLDQDQACDDLLEFPYLGWRILSECLLLLLSSKKSTCKIFVNLFLAERFWKKLRQSRCWGLVLVLSLGPLELVVVAVGAKTRKVYLGIVKGKWRDNARSGNRTNIYLSLVLTGSKIFS